MSIIPKIWPKIKTCAIQEVKIYQKGNFGVSNLAKIVHLTISKELFRFGSLCSIRIFSYIFSAPNIFPFQLKKNPKKITYVGIQNRRTDYLEFRRKRLGLDNLYEDYFEDSMEYFMEEYGPDVAFIYVSDDMKWGRRKLKDVPHAKRLFFLGCGDGQNIDCIGKDLALLGSCNHTITTHGTYGHWAAFLAGGEVYTEFGPIIPDAHA